MSQRSCIFEDTNSGIGMAYLHVSTMKVTQLLAKVVCLFGVYRPTRQFFTYMETSPLRGRAANYDLCSALMAIDQ